MKTKFLATDSGPNYYEITEETVNGIDLSMLESGDLFVGNDDTRAAGIRSAYRDEQNILYVELQQKVGPGHWRESDWIDAQDYDGTVIYAQYQKDMFHSGVPYAVTSEGRIHPLTKNNLDRYTDTQGVE